MILTGPWIPTDPTLVNSKKDELIFLLIDIRTCLYSCFYLGIKLTKIIVDEITFYISEVYDEIVYTLFINMFDCFYFHWE
jgi:hypothetical protein